MSQERYIKIQISFIALFYTVHKFVECAFKRKKFQTDKEFLLKSLNGRKIEKMIYVYYASIKVTKINHRNVFKEINLYQRHNLQDNYLKV